MAQKAWVIFCPENVGYDDNGGSILRFAKHETKYGIAWTQAEAEKFALKLAQQNPGQEIQILESVRGFHAQPSPNVITKVWNEHGEYVPL